MSVLCRRYYGWKDRQLSRGGWVYVPPGGKVTGKAVEGKDYTVTHEQVRHRASRVNEHMVAGL